MKKVIEVLLLLGAGMLFTSCGIIKGSNYPLIDEAIKTMETIPSDGPLEERIEDAIEAVTGLQTDLSPSNPDPDDLK